MVRFITLTGILLWSTTVLSHHSVAGVYDGQKRFIAEVEVREFELVNPHPLMLIEITGIPAGQVAEGIAIGQTWTLEMDNLRELTALGFHRETFLVGDQILVAVDPRSDTRYRENTLYMRAVEHRREGFIYLHNVRELFPIDAAEDNLGRLLDRVVN